MGVVMRSSQPHDRLSRLGVIVFLEVGVPRRKEVLMRVLAEQAQVVVPTNAGGWIVVEQIG
jgi:hypothetical protein